MTLRSVVQVLMNTVGDYPTVVLNKALHGHRPYDPESLQ